MDRFRNNPVQLVDIVSGNVAALPAGVAHEPENAGWGMAALRFLFTSSLV